jgi:hypothetical protein
MDPDAEVMGDFGSEDMVLIDRGKLTRLLGMEIPAIGLESEASFEKLMQALAKRRDRQRRWHLLIACLLGAATVIIGLFVMIRFLSRDAQRPTRLVSLCSPCVVRHGERALIESSPWSIAGRRPPSRGGPFATANRR